MRKVWHQLRREGFDVARCTVTRLMKDMGIQGIIRGKPHRTTIPDKKQPCPMDKVNRQFRVPAPNILWVSDFTYVATWNGFAYVAFVIDVYARRIVCWRVSTSPHAGFVLDALEQAVHERRPVKGRGLVHHSDRGSICRSDTQSDWPKRASSLQSPAPPPSTALPAAIRPAPAWALVCPWSKRSRRCLAGVWIWAMVPAGRACGRG